MAETQQKGNALSDAHAWRTRLFISINWPDEAGCIQSVPEFQLLTTGRSMHTLHLSELGQLPSRALIQAPTVERGIVDADRGRHIHAARGAQQGAPVIARVVHIPEGAIKG